MWQGILAFAGGAGTLLAMGLFLWYFFKRAATAESASENYAAEVVEREGQLEAVQEAAAVTETRRRIEEARVKQEITQRADVERARRMLRDAFNKGGSH